MKNISILGAGITGLSTSIALTKKGIAHEIYERTPNIAPVGAGILMPPNAMKIFDYLGISEEVKDAGVILEQLIMTDNKLNPIRKSVASLIQLNEYDLVSIHRAALHQVLLKHIDSSILHLNKGVTKCTIQKEHVEVSFDNETIETKIALGADGIHSAVQKSIFNISTRYAGYTCWRGIANVCLPAAYKNTATEALGNRKRFGFSPVSKNTVYWFAVLSAKENQLFPKDNLKEKLKTFFSEFTPLHIELIENTPQEQIVQHDISDLNRLETWHKGNICLLGDAAHATTPNMGQGGAQGVEDAFYIAHFLEKYKNPSEAFSAFEKYRRKKVDYIVNGSYQMGNMLHHPIGQKLVRAALKITPTSILEKQMKNLYAVDLDVK